MTIFRPRDERELSDIVAAALAREEPLEIVAGASKRGLGRPLQTPHTLDMSVFAGIRSYEPEELVLTAGAATTMRIIEAALTERRQRLAFRPPALGAAAGTGGGGGGRPGRAAGGGRGGGRGPPPAFSPAPAASRRGRRAITCWAFAP